MSIQSYNPKTNIVIFTAMGTPNLRYYMGISPPPRTVSCCFSILIAFTVYPTLYTPWRRLGGEEIWLLLIHDLGTWWGWVVSVTPRPRFTPGERTPRYPLYRRLGGPQSWSGHRGYRKNSLPVSGIEPRSPGRPACSQTLYCLSYPAHLNYSSWLEFHIREQMCWKMQLNHFPYRFTLPTEHKVVPCDTWIIRQGTESYLLTNQTIPRLVWN
jgi:hypothetical protein